MKIALLIVFVLGVLLYVVLDLRKKLQPGKPGETSSPDDSDNTPQECDAGGDSCGVTCFCDDQSLRRQMSEEIIYFEDEELDTYRDAAPAAYTEADVEAFAEVLATLRPNEVADWLHSLELRGITLPHQLREEATMMMQ